MRDPRIARFAPASFAPRAQCSFLPCSRDHEALAGEAPKTSRRRAARSVGSSLTAAPRRRAAQQGGRQPEFRGILSWKSLDYFVCPQQQRLRDRQAKRLSGLEVDDQLEL